MSRSVKKKSMFGWTLDMKYTQHLLGLTIVLILDLTLGLGGSCRLLLHLLLPPGPRPPGCPSRPLGSCCCCWQPLPRDEGGRPRHPGPTSALSSHQAQLFSSLFRFILYCSYWITMWQCSEEWTTCFWRFSLNSIHNINFKYVVFCSRLCDLNLKQYQCCGSLYIELGSGSGARILAQFGSGSRSGSGYRAIL